MKRPQEARRLAIAVPLAAAMIADWHSPIGEKAADARRRLAAEALALADELLAQAGYGLAPLGVPVTGEVAEELLDAPF